MKKYKLTNETKEVKGHILHRIQALTDFSDVEAGELGGRIESEKNLSQIGNAWVYDNAQVFDGARVMDSAIVCNNATVCGFACVIDLAQVCDCSVVGKMKETEEKMRIKLGRKFSIISSNPKYDTNYLVENTETKWIHKLNEKEKLFESNERR